MSQHSPNNFTGLIIMVLMYIRSKISVKVLVIFSMLGMFFLGRFSVPALKTEFHHFAVSVQDKKLKVYVDGNMFIESSDTLDMLSDNYTVGFSVNFAPSHNYIEDMFLIEGEFSKKQIKKIHKEE